MKKIVIYKIALVTIFCLILCDFGIAQTDSTTRHISLFTDEKSLNIGDIVTVYIMEFSSGSNQATVTSKKKNGVGFEGAGGGDFASSFPSMGFEFAKTKDLDGKGSTIQQGNLTGKISAVITEAVSPTVLKIEGQREVEVNGDKQTIKLSGLVRTQDINSSNIVYSYNIANAKISYKGKGPASGGKNHWWIFRLFGWIL